MKPGKVRTKNEDEGQGPGGEDGKKGNKKNKKKGAPPGPGGPGGFDPLTWAKVGTRPVIQSSNIAVFVDAGAAPSTTLLSFVRVRALQTPATAGSHSICIAKRNSTGTLSLADCSLDADSAVAGAAGTAGVAGGYGGDASSGGDGTAEGSGGGWSGSGGSNTWGSSATKSEPRRSSRRSASST